METILSYNPLFFAFVFPAVVDGIVTLVGQDKEYWDSKYRNVNEASPAYYFLKVSPWLFVAGSIVWFISWYFILLSLSEPFNLFVSLLFISGHSWGSGSWLRKMMRERGIFNRDNQISVIKSWCINVFYFCIIAGIATYALQIYFHNN